MSLEDWQKRLERHFEELATGRAASGLPLFALEHGLSEEEFNEVARLLHARLDAGLRLGAHWLVWVVYATELGYDYDGDEYWRSFEERTPQWRENASRSQLRDWFFKFKKVYRGVEPSGPWAEFFSIIAWPITHAILPKYLQLQFASALYDMRYSLAGLDALGPTEVGRLLADNAWDASSRFRKFLEQRELVGRIVLALLGDKALDGQGPVYGPTLERIVSGLERVRKTREWLKEARRVIAPRFKGTGHSWSSDTIQGAPRGGDSSLPRIRPSLLLRPSGVARWSVIIEIPSFGAVARRNPDIKAFLRSTRYRVAGTGDAWLPADWLLSNAQRRTLKAWPERGQPLVRVERQHPAIVQLLESECQLASGPIWLFRIGSDGVAREVRGKLVRPGGSYIVLSRWRLPSDSQIVMPCDVDCDGINAGLISIQDTVSTDNINQFKQLGLQVAQTIQIWPAGVYARAWDDEGYSEWLTTEPPCFGIVHDHPVDTYILRLNQGALATVQAGPVGQPVFISLPPLPAGRHFLSVKAQRKGGSPELLPAQKTEGSVTLVVREPEPWVPGTTLHKGLAVLVEPCDPTLDDLLEGKVAVSVFGPEGCAVSCKISFAKPGGAELLSQQVGIFELPFSADDLSKRLNKLLGDEKYAWAHMEAASACLTIAGEELGQYVVKLEREFKPVRWVCRTSHHRTIIRLIDETDRDSAATVQFFSFEQPARPIPLDVVPLAADFEAETPGGLYLAEHDLQRDALIVSTLRVSHSFRDLAVNPDLRSLKDNSVSNAKILRSLELWSNARLAGPLAGIRRDCVTSGILNLLYARLCGGRWAQAEAAYLSDLRSDPAVRRLQQLVGTHGFATVLRTDYQKQEMGTSPGAQWFSEVAARYGVSLDSELCEFALRLASQPHQLSSVFGGDLYLWLHKISSKPILLRGARFVALLAIKEAGVSPTMAIPRWKW